MPGEIIVAVCKHLDPRSVLNLAAVHQHFRGFVDDKKIWFSVQMHTSWCFTNDTLIAMGQFAHKVQHISFKRTGAVQAHVQSLPQGLLCKMRNLITLSVESAAFTQGYFLQLLPNLQSLQLLHCPHFDIEILVEALQRVGRHKAMQHLNLCGVPRVSSLNKWQICSLCPNLQEAKSKAVMGDFIAEQCFIDCPHLTVFNCVPLPCTHNKWQELRIRFPRIAFGHQICSQL